MLQEKGRFQQHAYGGEKEQCKKIPDRNNIAQGLVAVVRFTQHHTRHKGAKGKGKTEQIGYIAYLRARWR